MQYTDVCIESFGYTIPDEIWDSATLESKLEPIYKRLRLPEGRLELMTGIRERRFWPRETKPSELSQNSARLALEAADFDPSRVGSLIHGSGCRDFLEPATACTVHNQLGLPRKCRAGSGRHEPRGGTLAPLPVLRPGRLPPGPRLDRGGAPGAAGIRTAATA